MTDATNLAHIARAFLRRGYSPEQASEFAVLLGDTWEMEGDQVLVRDESGRELARIPESELE